MKFNINLDNLSFGGFAPGYWKATYPTFGNNNQAADIVSCDLTDPLGIKQGVGLATITGTVTTLMKGMTNTVLSSDETSGGIGGTEIYAITPTTVTSVNTIKASTVQNFPLANATPAAPYDGAPWTNPTYAYTDNSQSATSDNASTTKYSIWKSFTSIGDLVPAGATITGIRVLVRGYGTPDINGDYYKFKAFLTKDGSTVVGTVQESSTITGTEASYWIGSPTNLWGTTWAKADFTSDFGVMIYGSATGTGITFSINYIKMQIFYTPTTEDGEDIITITGSEILYSHGTKVGYSDLTTYHDAVYTGLVSGAPHQFEFIPGSTIGFLSDGYKIHRIIYPGSTPSDYSTVLTFTDNTSLTSMEIQSIKWHDYRLWIAANFPNYTGRKRAMLYSYNGSGSTYEKSIPIDGELGALFEKDRMLFVFYKKNYEEGVCTLAYCDGYKLVDLKEYYGSLPAYYQVSTYKDFLIWMSGTTIMAFGSGVVGAPNRIFKLGVGSTGGIANPFGTPLVAFSDALKSFSGYTVTSSWKSLMFDITFNSFGSVITNLAINFEQLTANARVDVTLKDNQGRTLYTGIISYDELGAATSFNIPLKILAENFRIEFDYSNGNTTNTVQIKNIKIQGQES